MIAYNAFPPLTPVIIREANIDTFSAFTEPLGDVSKTNRANQEDSDFLIGRTNQGLGNGDLHISLSWPNLVILSHLSCRDHFCFYHRFGLVTFRDCTN